jgi:hypothetical protein
MGSHCLYIDGALRVVPDEHWDVAGSGPIGAALAYPDDPTKIYDPATGSFVDNVTGERSRLIAVAKVARDAAQAGGCDTPKGRVDTDPDSRTKINVFYNVALGAKIEGVAYSVDWTMQDASIRTHSADEMIRLGGAVAVFLDAVHQAYLAKRAALNAATTLDALWAIVLRAS